MTRLQLLHQRRRVHSTFSGTQAGWKPALPLGLFCRGLGRERFGLFGELREAGGVLHGNVRQDFAIEGNARGLQAMDQLALGDAVLASSSADALNPQAAVLTLFYTAIALCVAIGAIGRFLRGLIQLALCEEKTFCPLEILLTPSPAFCAAFYAWHGFAPFFLLCVRNDWLRIRAFAGEKPQA